MNATIESKRLRMTGRLVYVKRCACGEEINRAFQKADLPKTEQCVFCRPEDPDRPSIDLHIDFARRAN